MDPEELANLKADHTKEAIHAKLSKGPQHSYLKDFVYGAMDGIVTTFAVVGGVVGAELSQVTIIILGFANIAADGFSMAVGNFLGTKAEVELRDQIKKMELDHIERVPEGEREEIRQIFAAKGFEGEKLESAVKTITSDKNVWVETMLVEEYGIPKQIPSPLTAAGSTFIAFATFGLLPLLPYLLQYAEVMSFEKPFYCSLGLTAVAFFAVGVMKSQFVAKSWLKSGLETFWVGSIAAGLAYAVGVLLRDIIH